MFFVGKGRYMLSPKKIRDPGIFESENFAAYAPCTRPNLPIFGNWTHKNTPDRQRSARFRKSKKVLYHSTLMCTELSRNDLLDIRRLSCRRQDYPGINVVRVVR